MFQMLGNDFLRDPFFQDPFRHLFTQTVFPNPAQDVTPWASARLPQRRGREVPIESSGHLSAESAAQPGFSIEEVHDSDQVPTSRHTPVVEEPDEGQTQHVDSHGRAQSQENAVMHPLQSFFDNYAFGDPRAFGLPDAGNMVLYSTSVMAQQGPGVEFSQFHSSTYGSHGVSEHQMRLKDSQTGHEEIMIGRQLGDKARTVTKRCQADGTQSQQQHLRNLAEQEADHFDEEWTYEAERSLPMYMRNSGLPQASRTNMRPAVGYRC